MIPATSFGPIVDGKAWVICPNEIEHDSDPDWLRLAFWHGSDRPCGTCGGKPWWEKHWWSTPHKDWLRTLPDERFDLVASTCPDCDGTGRHTFDIEVAWQTEVDAYESERLRVSVVPGMVLPIVDCVGAFAEVWENFTPNPAVLWRRGNVYNVGPKLLVGNTLTRIALPPAAAPGMWAVQVQVQS
jgi:hypothetical protein